MSRMLSEILNPELAQDREFWRTFHENSKTERHDRPPRDEEVRRRMAELRPSLRYEGYPTFPLPEPMALEVPLGETMRQRQTCREMEVCRLSLAQLSTLLFHAYGETRSNEGTGFPRPFRIVPSGGALYPLELYVHSARIDGLEPGLYHYNPAEEAVARVVKGDFSHRLCSALAQSEIPLRSAAQLFVTAFFERSTFKYRERSYRFILIEAGHAMQNFCLAATGLGLGTTCIGGFFDREIDEILGCDGLRRGTIYMAAVGATGERDSNTIW